MEDNKIFQEDFKELNVSEKDDILSQKVDGVFYPINLKVPHKPEGDNEVDDKDFSKKLQQVPDEFSGKIPVATMAEKNYRGHSDWKPYRSESEDGKPKCKKCRKEYSSVKSLKDHVKYVHLKKEPRIRPLEPVDERTCVICKRLFDKSTQLKLHLVRHTKIFKSLNVEGKIKRSEDRRSATCLECGKWDGKANNIKQHIAQVHYQLHKTIDLTNTKNYDLSEGGTALKGAGTVARKKKALQTLQCKLCEKGFVDYDRSNLNKHIRYVHEGIRREKKTWFCENCDKQFSDSKGLKKHSQFKHLGFGCKCEICGYNAITPLGLVKHRSGKHGFKMAQVPVEVSSSSFQCMECGKFYSSKSVLKTHMAIHTKDKLVKCDKCEKMFCQKVVLNKHIRRKHTYALYAS